jgi:dienelactone hydrolase
VTVDPRKKSTKKRYLLWGLVIALIVMLLVGTSMVTGLSLNTFQLLAQAKVTIRGIDAYNRIRKKASQGYDMRAVRATWSQAKKAYQARQYTKADNLLDGVSQGLRDSRKVGYRIYYRSAGGIKVSGLVFKPIRGSKPWPTIAVNHPGFGSAADFSDVALMFRDRGYLTFCPDYRGGGKSEGKTELAKGEVDDVINGIEYLRTRGLVDENRIGMYGQSHGAAISLLAASRYHRIKAVVEASGFTDLAELYRYHVKNINKSKLSKSLVFYFSLIGGTPDKVPEEYKVRSAINYVNDIQAAVLIIHGGKDPLIPVSQAREMYEAMRSAGKTVEIKIYPNAGHGGSDPEAHQELERITFGWFEKYM